MDSRKKILIIADYYLPGYKGGGPVKSISGIVNALSFMYDFYIITRDRDLGDKSPYPNIAVNTWQTVGKAQVFYASPQQLSLLKLRRLFRTIDYDLLYLNSFFSTLSVKLMWLHYFGLIPANPVVLAPRGEMYMGALALKTWKKRPYLALVRQLGMYKDVQWQASTDEETATIKALFANAQVRTALELPLRPLPPMPDLKARQKQEITSLVFISRISPKKNLDLALRLLMDVKTPVQFDIYGPQEDTVYWRQCEALIAQLPAHVRASYQGSLLPREVVPAFARYHAFLFPTFGENYGYVIWEALYAGCPVIISDQTPWNDLSALGIGWTLPLDQPDHFVSAIHEIAAWNAEDTYQIAEKAHQYAVNFADDPAREEPHRVLFDGAIFSG